MNDFKRTCIALRKQDFTLPEIVRKTGRSKTSVYFHIKDTPLSSKKLRKIRESSKRRIMRIAASRKGKALRPYKSFSYWSPELVLLVGHLLFDGEIARSRCVYSSRNTVLIARVTKLMRFVYDYPPRIYSSATSGVQHVGYHNVELGAFLNQKSTELQKRITHLSTDHQRSFIRAFFDDEGCMDFHSGKKQRRIRGYQKNRTMLRHIQRLLKNFRIDSSLQGKNEIVITGKNNLESFRREINFSSGVMVNGNRINSRWKKDLEKRVLLARAIASYKR